MAPAKHLFRLDDALERGHRFRRVNAAQRLDGFHAQIRSGARGQIAVNNGKQSAQRFAVGSHANFVDDQRHDQRIDMIEQLEKNSGSVRERRSRKSGVRCGPARPCGKSFIRAGKKTSTACGIELAQAGPPFRRLRRSGRLAPCCAGIAILLRRDRRPDWQHARHLRAELQRLKSRGKLLHRRLRQQLQHIGQTGGDLPRAQGFIDEFWHALFDAHLCDADCARFRAAALRHRTSNRAPVPSPGSSGWSRPPG